MIRLIHGIGYRPSLVVQSAIILEIVFLFYGPNNYLYKRGETSGTLCYNLLIISLMLLGMWNKRNKKPKGQSGCQSLDYLCPVSCVPDVATVSGLSLSCVLCTRCCHCLWIVFVLCLVYPMLPLSLDCLCPVYPMLPLSLDCLCPVSCVPDVASVSGLFLPCVLCTRCCQSLDYHRSYIYLFKHWFVKSISIKH
jgi:hypothetical protein